jgi:hypothetical protein
MEQWRYRSTTLNLGNRWREWSASKFGRFNPREIAPSTHWIWGCVSPTVGMDAMEKRKILCSLAIEHVVRRCTDWAIAALVTKTTVQNNTLMLVDLLFKDEIKFRYLGTTVTNKNYIRNEIKSRSSYSKDCYIQFRITFISVFHPQF